MTDATTNLTIGCGIVLGVGSVVDGKMPNMKLIFAGAVVVVGLSVLDNIEPELSAGFAGIMFIALCAKYLPTMIDKLGFSGGNSGTDIQPQDTNPAPVTPQKVTPQVTKPALPAAFVPANTSAVPTAATAQNSSGR